MIRSWSVVQAYLCDSNDNSKKSETNKALRNHQVLLAAHLEEAAELAAMIQGLSWALKLVVKSIQFFCDDDSIILDYVSRSSLLLFAFFFVLFTSYVFER